MIVSELIELLKTMPQDAQVCVNNEQDGIFHEVINDCFFSQADKDDPEECVVIVVNEL